MNNIASAFLLAAQHETGKKDLAPIVNEFIRQIDLGLAGQAESLAALSSRFSTNEKIITDKPIIVMDAGGTHLRIGLIELNKNNKPNIVSSHKYPMPGSHTHISANKFYDALCDGLEPVITQSDRIGFCFSYPCEINTSKDGKLLYWTKEIKAPEVEGQWIGRELKQRIKKRFGVDRQICLLNDTVATLLAGRYDNLNHRDQPDCYIGLILGTGTNCAYSSNVSGAIINMESGNFNGGQLSAFDSALDSSTQNPGTYLFEKKIAGKYLGPLLGHMLDSALEKKLFTAANAALIERRGVTTTSTLSNLLSHTLPDNTNVPAWFSQLTTDGKSIVSSLADAIIDRAAFLTAANIASGIVKSLELQKDPIKPSNQKTCLITIDGSTFYQTPGLRSKVESLLDGYFNNTNFCNHEIKLTYRQMTDAPLIGSAIAASTL